MNNRRLDASDLAELVGKLALHQHLCLIYETQEEQFSAAIPFLKIGLERGEKCIYVADAKTTAALMDAMRADGIDVDTAVRQASLRATKGYPLPGDFVPDRMVSFLAESAKAARSEGYSALRVIGEMTWVTRIDPCPERLIEFEAKVNHLFRDEDALAICQYDRRVFPSEVLLEILRTHPTVAYGACVCENPYYVPPDEYLNPRHYEREIERMLARMRQDTASREKLRQSEIRIRQSSEQHRKETRALIDAIPQQIWSGPPDGSLDFCNERWRSYTGLCDEELQGQGWQSMLHPDDRERVLKAWQESVANGTPYEQEERHRGADGGYRWFLSRGVPVRDAEGRIVRWYGTNTDIEDRKHAEEQVRRLSGRILQSQDEERRRIARDLHDSTGQNLVALATMLSQLRGSITSKERKSRRLLSECKALADRCISEVRTLAYVLHPPALDQTGLIGAIRDYVRGFTKRSGIQVELELSPTVGRTARDVELALFRVVQESLTNIQRHSGSRNAKICVDRDSNLTLEISNNRNGNSGRLPRRAAKPSFQFGVGIRSMQERVKLIGGQLDIDTTSYGTIVRVTVPLGNGHEKTTHSDS